MNIQFSMRQRQKILGFVHGGMGCGGVKLNANSAQMSPTLASKLVCSLLWHHYPLGSHHSGFHETGFTPASFSSSVLQRPSSPQLTIMRDPLKRACFFMEVSSSRSTISQHDFKCYQGKRVFCQEGFLV